MDLASPLPHSSVKDGEAEIARRPSGGEELEADELPLTKDRSDWPNMKRQKRQLVAEGKDGTQTKTRMFPQEEDAEEMLHELGQSNMLDAAAKSDREIVDKRIFHGGLHTHKHTHIHVLERLSLKHQQEKVCSRSQSQGTHESVRGTKARPGCKSRGIERERERERGRKRRQELKGIAVTESNLQTASGSLTPAAESENQDCASEEKFSIWSRFDSLQTSAQLYKGPKQDCANKASHGITAVVGRSSRPLRIAKFPRSETTTETTTSFKVARHSSRLQRRMCVRKIVCMTWEAVNA